MKKTPPGRKASAITPGNRLFAVCRLHPLDLRLGYREAVRTHSRHSYGASKRNPNALLDVPEMSR